MDARPAWDDERDELVEPAEGIEDNLEEFLQDVTGQFAGSSTGVNVKPLEKSLEDQKRQLANMELQLREAKRQSEAESKMATVTKQNNTLETMTSLMSKAAAEETKNCNRQRGEADTAHPSGPRLPYPLASRTPNPSSDSMTDFSVRSQLSPRSDIARVAAGRCRSQWTIGRIDYPGSGALAACFAPGQHQEKAQ